MLSDDDHPGIFTFMLGMIVVVMVGVWLSLGIEHRFQRSSGSVELESAIDQDAKLIGDLRGQHTERSQKLAVLVPQRQEVSERHAAEVARLRQSAAEVDRLAAARSALELDLEALEQDFARCRGEYRRNAWAAAAGQKIALLQTSDGREYRDATIVRVTEVGLEIRHATGVARIEAPALGVDWQERFQWNDEERRTQLNEERLANAEVNVPAPAPPPKPPADNTAALRTAVTLARVNVANLARELDIARANLADGRKRSAPGSLETWDARVRRLSAELEQAELIHERAKAVLKAKEPQDPALLPQVPES